MLRNRWLVERGFLRKWGICIHELCEKFVYKHSEKIEYAKNFPTF